MCQPTKAVGGLIGRLADKRHVQAAGQSLSDVLEGDALVANGVVARSCGTPSPVRACRDEQHRAGARRASGLEPSPTYAESPFSRASLNESRTKP